MKYLLITLCSLFLSCTDEADIYPYGEIDGLWSVVYYNKSPMLGQITEYDSGEVVFKISLPTVTVEVIDTVQFDRINEGMYNISFEEGSCDFEDFRTVYFDEMQLGTLSIAHEDSIVISEGCVDGSIVSLIR